MDTYNCFHCGLGIQKNQEILFHERNFCCVGCKTVYEIFSVNDLTAYYDFAKNPGAIPQNVQGKFNFLDNEKIVAKLLDFQENETCVVSLYIPHIHCSSCIWILENLHKLQEGINTSEANFPEKKVRIIFNPEKISLKNIVILLASIGYEPYISLENYNSVKPKSDRSLLYKVGVAFFCFGNVMLLSFPEYFEVNEYWINHYKDFFRWLIFTLSLPSFLYSASGYYISAYNSLRTQIFNIDIPIALGIIVMFVRSTVDIVFDYGQGFFDSLTALVFFMLLGRLFQNKTYDFLSFERDFRSYFPIAVTKINPDKSEVSTPVYEVKKGDRLLIRNQELIPADGILMSQNTQIDYSFVTGEAVPIYKNSGDKIFAGGKHLGNTIEMEVLNSVSQSYLTQLWSNEAFAKKNRENFKTITDKISYYFTPILLIFSIVCFTYWIFIDANIAFNVFTAILIVACPCALALTAPFTLGNVLRIIGRKKLYLKNATVIEQLSKVDTLVFDKTGTITTNQKTKINYEGISFSADQKAMLKNLLRGSNHPLSRQLYDFLPDSDKIEINDFEEITGKGIQGFTEGYQIKLGSANFVGFTEVSALRQTNVHISINEQYFGKFIFENHYRDGLNLLFKNLNNNYKIIILSGDNDGEREILETLLPKNTHLVFNQKPEEKMEFIKNLQLQGKNVMMIGDGLNDAGALVQSNVGISVSENINVFSPACDGILDASVFKKLHQYLTLSKNAVKVIKMSFALSIIYNIVGLSFAALGKLSPLIAAIIMPLSTVTIVSFTTLMSNLYASKIFKK
ncbi:HAD-IC family P-type ATPase [Flavobacterium sp. NST-5]|uniref:HAD-IC family P-type ATPase n=1 Tax=Flavobacterium ichthyis TaxID=2698827 RepID=A0ABW9Z5B9_9FLAO|nr:heavy metal translocating P-type ATPase metal-binding domain-containing protein [Flavobacterium ichthyis]NBL64038.1 HAD-IC family P-type ATPase [Flavobacterium ichthyis]